MLPTGMPIHNSGANKGQKRKLYTGTNITDSQSEGTLYILGIRYGTSVNKSVLVTI